MKNKGVQTQILKSTNKDKRKEPKLVSPVAVCSEQMLGLHERLKSNEKKVWVVGLWVTHFLSFLFSIYFYGKHIFCLKKLFEYYICFSNYQYLHMATEYGRPVPWQLMQKERGCENLGNLTRFQEELKLQ